jgi:very-short-patch-repair endonuclease
VAIELDGFAFHSDRSVFEDDRARANELVAMGWTVLRFTWDQVVHRPAWVVSVIRRVLTRAA